MSELLADLRSAELDADHFCEVRHRVKYEDRFHLFIDDVDKFKPTDFKSEALFRLIDTIWNRKLSLTVTSNYSLTELQEKLDPAVVRRLDDICQALDMRKTVRTIRPRTA